MTTRKLRGAMIGGGVGSLVGSVHRTALAMDGSTQLVAGMFSRDAQQNQDSGAAMGVAPERCYSSVPGLIAGERDLDWVSVMTPNNVHFEQLSALVRPVSTLSQINRLPLRVLKRRSLPNWCAILTRCSS